MYFLFVGTMRRVSILTWETEDRKIRAVGFSSNDGNIAEIDVDYIPGKWLTPIL